MDLTERPLISPGRKSLLLPVLVLLFANFILFRHVSFSPITHRSGGVSPKLEAAAAESSITPTAIMASAPGVFSLPVIQQPEGKTIFVANRSGLLTQFSLASQNGIIGLMAHNYLSGKDFYKLVLGQEVVVHYTDHHVGRFRVTSIHRFQKEHPTKLYSDFIDLDTRQKLTTSQVFDRFYRGGPHVIFQTCLEGEGRKDWGILFVVALPISE